MTMMKRWLRRGEWLSEPLWPRVPWLIKADYVAVFPALVVMLLRKQYTVAGGYFAFVVLYRALVAFLVRRSEETRRLAQQFDEDWDPYFKAIDRGEWPNLPKPAPPPPEDEGPKAA